MGLIDMPFDIANVTCQNGKAMAHTRIGWFRAVSNIPRAWAIGSFVADEPVMTHGRIELLWYVEEQSISDSYHRYGNLGSRANEDRIEVA